MSIAEWREMPKKPAICEKHCPRDTVCDYCAGFGCLRVEVLRDRLRDTAAALDATLNEVDPPYADFRAILKRLKEEGLM